VASQKSQSGSAKFSSRQRPICTGLTKPAAILLIDIQLLIDKKGMVRTLMKSLLSCGIHAQKHCIIELQRFVRIACNIARPDALLIFEEVGTHYPYIHLTIMLPIHTYNV